jgi:hypothetical protein
MAMNPRLLVPRATGFNPKSIAGLEIWFDATDPGTIDTDTGVSEWRDKSGLGRVLLQGSGNNQPPLVTSGIGGKPSLSFTALSDHFMRGAFVRTLTQMTSIVVARMDTGTTSNARTFSLQIPEAGADFQSTGHLSPCLRQFTNNALASYHDNGFRAVRSITLGSPFIHSATHTGTVLSNRVNNGTAEAYTYTTPPWSAAYNGMSVNTANGAGAAGADQLTGLISEILLYNRALSDSERSVIHKYLGKKYGINVS